MISDKKKAHDKSLRGHASQFFVAGELCRRDFVAVVTMGNCPNTDILCSNVDGTKFVHIQVKTFVPGNKTCSVGQKAEKDYGDHFFWVLAGIPLQNSPETFQYYVIPSPMMAKEIRAAHETWLATPGVKGQKHKDWTGRMVPLPPKKSRTGWDVSGYLGRWDLIQKKLK